MGVMVRINFYIPGVCFRRTLIKQSEERRAEALHIIIPHCINWKMTEACVETFSRLTQGPFSITIVNNFDSMPADLKILQNPKTTVIRHQWTLVGSSIQKVLKRRLGSEENALGLDAAVVLQSWFEWGFMAHTDSAPLIRGWNKYYFDALKGAKIMGNYRDTTRIHAAHASGTLFHQKSLVENKVSLRPEYKKNVQVLDVGDRATVVLHDRERGEVPVLPNTMNDKTLIERLEQNSEILGSLAKDNSTIALDASATFPVFGHLGRGTPRSLKDPKFAKKLPQDIWIDLLQSIK